MDPSLACLYPRCQLHFLNQALPCYPWPVNLMLLNQDEWGTALGPSDPRTVHVRTVLGLKPGDPLKIGLLGSGTGSATVLSAEGPLVLDYPRTLEAPRPRLGLNLVLGHCRPLVMQRLFKDLASLGTFRIQVVNAGLTEASYFRSSFWAKSEYLNFLLEGASQGGEVVLPEVTRHYSLDDALADLPQGSRLACHPGDHPSLAPLMASVPPREALSLAIGPERGWSGAELDMLRTAGFTICSMGPRILRTELAAASLAVLRAMQ